MNEVVYMTPLPVLHSGLIRNHNHQIRNIHQYRSQHSRCMGWVWVREVTAKVKGNILNVKTIDNLISGLGFFYTLVCQVCWASHQDIFGGGGTACR